MILLDSTFSPDWLKYEFPGLVAIFAIMMYMFFKPIIAQETNKKFWALLFIIVSLIFLSIGGLYVYSNDKMKNNKLSAEDSLNTKINDLRFRLNVYTDSTSQGNSLRKKITQNKVNYDSLLTQNKLLDKDIVFQKGLLNKLIINRIVEELNNDLIATEGKRNLRDKIEVEYKRLKQAVFLTILSFNADKDILKSALTFLVKENDEFTNADVDKLLTNYNGLLKLRLKWLKETAIPSLEAQMYMFRKSPQIQQGENVNVTLPDEVIILKVDDLHGGNQVNVSNLSELKREITVIQNQLTK